MSNSWAYEILVPRPLKEGDIEQVRLLAADRGYSPLNPVSGRVGTMTPDGMDVREYSSIADAEAVLAASGGRLQLWKGEIDLAISVHPSLNSEIDALADPAPNGWSRIALVVDGCFLRDEAVRTVVAADLWALFVSSCERLDAAYGFSRDEDIGEAFIEEAMRLPATVAAGDKPPLLFWLNYFRREHFPWISEAMFSRAGGWVTSMARGMLVSVFDVPWEVELAKLREVSHRFRTQ